MTTYNESGEEVVARVRDEDFYEGSVGITDARVEAYRDVHDDSYAVLLTTAWEATLIGRIRFYEPGFEGRLFGEPKGVIVDDGVTGVLRQMAEAVEYTRQHPEPEVD